MDTQDKDFMAKFMLVLGALVIFTVVVFLIARLLSVMTAPTVDSEDTVHKAKLALMNERLGKVGSVETFDPNAEVKVRSGKEISDSTCNSCHATGVLNAPIVGDSAAWTPRMAGGLDALVTSAITGKGGMPPKGGDPTLTDEEMRSVVEYMLTESGVDAAAGGSAAAAPAAVEPPAAPAASSVPATAAVETVKEAAATVADAGKKAAVAGAVAAGSAAVAAVTGGDNTGAAQAPAPAAPASAPAAPTVDAATLEHGKMVYKTACFACHDSGVANAPKLGDAAIWQTRMGAGMDTLINNAINGKGAMPPKGGRLDLGNADIEAAVLFMVSN